MIFFFTVHVPGGYPVTALAWEGGDLRIALAVQSHIYFANIRPDYRWSFFENTLFYTYYEAAKKRNSLMYWDAASTEHTAKSGKDARKVLRVAGGGENCVLACETSDGSGQFVLKLCNSIGNPIIHTYIAMEPNYIVMTAYHVIVADTQNVIVWQYRTRTARITSLKDRHRDVPGERGTRVCKFHIDDMSLKMSDLMKAGENAGLSSHGSRAPPAGFNSICGLAASESKLIVARENGSLQQYSLPHVSLENKMQLPCRPLKLRLNCDSTRLGLVDINGILSLWELRDEDHSDHSTGQSWSDSQRNEPRIGTKRINFKRKDSWDLRWADDDPLSFAYMEKTRMYIVHDTTAEDPVMCAGYLASYKELKVRVVLLDEIMEKPTRPSKAQVVEFEAKAMRDCRDILENVDLPEAYKYIDENPHKCLWKLLTKKSLEKLDLTLADKAFVRCKDYAGVQFVKRLTKLKDKTKQQAEICAYNQEFDKAEQMYRDIDRRDLAIELRRKIGDWFGVVQLLKSAGGSGGNDTVLQNAWGEIGEYYWDRHLYDKAAQYYRLAKRWPELAQCYVKLEEFSKLNELSEELPEGHSLLKKLGEYFSDAGLYDAAVTALLKAGDSKGAVDSCVLLNQWGKAIELAEAHGLPQINTLFSKYATQLMERGGLQGRINAIQLFRRANKGVEAAKLLGLMADESYALGDVTQAKQFQMLAALEVERHRDKLLNLGGKGDTTRATTIGGKTRGAATVQQTLDTLIKHDSQTGNNKAVESCWRRAEAFHFLIRAHEMLYKGDMDKAMNCALRAAENDDVVNPKQAWSLVAVTTYCNKFFGQCSKAFVKLENLRGLNQTEKDGYENLAVAIFSNNPPTDPSSRSYHCPKCNSGSLKEWDSSCSNCGTNFPACIVTGRIILNRRTVYCKICRHYAHEQDLQRFENCPLCHSPRSARVDRQRGSRDLPPSSAAAMRKKKSVGNNSSSTAAILASASRANYK